MDKMQGQAKMFKAHRQKVLSYAKAQDPWGPIHKISYNLLLDLLKFIVRLTYDSDLQHAEISLRDIVN